MECTKTLFKIEFRTLKIFPFQSHLIIMPSAPNLLCPLEMRTFFLWCLNLIPESQSHRRSFFFSQYIKVLSLIAVIFTRRPLELESSRLKNSTVGDKDKVVLRTTNLLQWIQSFLGGQQCMIQLPELLEW